MQYLNTDYMHIQPVAVSRRSHVVNLQRDYTLAPSLIMGKPGNLLLVLLTNQC